MSKTSVLTKDEIKGFKIIPIKVPASPIFIKCVLKNSEEHNVIHYIYVKPHQLKDSSSDESSNNKSLFVINLPQHITDIKTLRAFFHQISDGSLIQDCNINSVASPSSVLDLNKLTSEFFDTNNAERNESVSQRRLPLNTALVTFVDKAALKLFMSQVKKTIKPTSINNYPTLENFNYENFQTFNFLDIDSLKESINVSLLEFNKKEADEEEEIQNQGTIIDEDGFQLVVGKHRKTKAAIMGKSNRMKLVNNEHLSDDLDDKNKAKQRSDFYRFQIRERKKQEMSELLKKFKDDQQRIKELRERKRFRPY